MDELDRPPLTSVAAMSEAGAAGSTRFWAGVGGNHPDHITPARLPPAASKPSYVHGGCPATQQTTNMASSAVVGELTSARSASLQSRARFRAANVDLCSLSVLAEHPPAMVSISNGTTARIRLPA